MGLFQALVRTVVNVACLPADAVNDVVRLVDPDHDLGESIRRRVETIKEEANDD